VIQADKICIYLVLNERAHASSERTSNCFIADDYTNASMVNLVQANELTSRKIYNIFKNTGFNCQLNIFKASPPELATVWVHNGGMWWMIEGVWRNLNHESNHEDYEIDIQFKAQILFEDRNSCKLVIKRISKLLLGAKTYLCGSKDFSRPVPLLIIHTIPLIADDEIEEQLIMNQFHQFKSAVCYSIGCEAKQET
jgi:hypothetical protein